EEVTHRSTNPHAPPCLCARAVRNAAAAGASPRRAPAGRQLSTLDPRMADALARLPDYLGNHVLVSVSSLALGLAVSLPLAIISVRRPILRNAALAFTSIVQTIPGLALLA